MVETPFWRPVLIVTICDATRYIIKERIPFQNAGQTRRQNHDGNEQDKPSINGKFDDFSENKEDSEIYAIRSGISTTVAQFRNRLIAMRRVETVSTLRWCIRNVQEESKKCPYSWASCSEWIPWMALCGLRNYRKPVPSCIPVQSI
jgi:hypothetical protein